MTRSAIMSDRPPIGRVLVLSDPVASRFPELVVLDKGRVAESGTHGELLARGALYAALWREQERAKGWRLGRPDEGAGRLVAES